MKATDQKGFGAVEVLLIAVVVGILGFTGYYVWHSQSETNKAYDDAGKSENASLEYIKDSTQADFEACKKAAGSRMLQTYPEQCVTKDGKVYTTAAVTPSTTSQSDAQNYLIIKEWGVKVPLTYVDKLAYVYDDMTRPAGGYLDVATDSTVSLSLKSDVGATSECNQLDLKWSRSKQKSSSTDPISKVGEYYYYIWGDGAPRECGATVNQIQTKTTAEQLANPFTAS